MGTLRIHFTMEDLARTRLARGADPMWEIVLSRFRLREGSVLPFRPWFRQVQTRRAGWQEHRRQLSLLSALLPTGVYFPDFLTPAAGLHGLDAGLDALRSTPRRRLSGELAQMSRTAPVPVAIRGLADGDAELLGAVAAAFRRWDAELIAPYRPVLDRAVAADLAVRAHALATGGLEALLAGLSPLARWRPPVLEVDYPETRDLVLDGRGLTLVPSFFCFRKMISLADASLSPTLLYPIDRSLLWAETVRRSSGSLATLLGATRAELLRVAEAGVTTSQLAIRLGIAPSSVSRHAATLAAAGLLDRIRHGAAVWHLRTPLGQALLDGAADRDPVSATRAE
ncbi:transcriptional regulator [Actinocatenispora sera]|uniref:transcriptional regulator n=1 Tax=Actinocatenispora sera TaxID=390989 RepID=UPI0033D9F0A2